MHLITSADPRSPDLVQAPVTKYQTGRLEQ